MKTKEPKLLQAPRLIRVAQSPDPELLADLMVDEAREERENEVVLAHAPRWPTETINSYSRWGLNE
jgi:hypothetical protein